MKLNFRSLLISSIFILTVGFYSIGVSAQTLQSYSPGTADNGNTHITGTGLFETGVGIGASVKNPEGVLDAGDRVDPDPYSGECLEGYIHVDYNGDTLINYGECWRGMVVKDGNVGIGTVSPTQKLDVAGQIAIKGVSVIDSVGNWVGNPIGHQGQAGPKGDKGDKGDTGEKGDPGVQGIQGIAGADGAKGDKADWHGSLKVPPFYFRSINVAGNKN